MKSTLVKTDRRLATQENVGELRKNGMGFILGLTPMRFRYNAGQLSQKRPVIPAKFICQGTPLRSADIDDIIDCLVSVSRQIEIYYLWRPFLKDAKDDMVFEVAVSAQCDHIVTFNKRDFQGCEQFGVTVLTPQEFLLKRGG